ncbi:hypothetical protein N0X72_00905 [Streptomyces carpaticus]|uniref:hypothetical protein n=1 Tax=Streptomyces carpaticus TaxID=285558 RepID=UPI00220F4A50|nr:hypothetical protein N0X72_00905 [Streptomyces carpaticus]
MNETGTPIDVAIAVHGSLIAAAVTDYAKQEEAQQILRRHGFSHRKEIDLFIQQYDAPSLQVKRTLKALLDLQDAGYEVACDPELTTGSLGAGVMEQPPRGMWDMLSAVSNIRIEMGKFLSASSFEANTQSTPLALSLHHKTQFLSSLLREVEEALEDVAVGLHVAGLNGPEPARPRAAPLRDDPDTPSAGR